MDEITIKLTIEEIADILELLDQGYSDGYINDGDPILTAIEKLNYAYVKWRRCNKDIVSEEVIEGEYGSNESMQQHRSSIL